MFGGEALRKIFFRVGLALAAAYALCAVCWYAGVPAVRFIYPVIRLAEAALLFLIPGVLIGAGLEKAEFKHYLPLQGGGGSAAPLPPCESG